MSWIVDGSNLLGALHVDRHADHSKRKLVQMLAAFARAKRTRVLCLFDGAEPPSFARHLGAVTVVFSGSRTADELIIERAAAMRDAKVVTSDRGLAARVAGRRVTIVAPRDFVREMEAAGAQEMGTPEDDWLAYFSDPKNRNV